MNKNQETKNILYLAILMLPVCAPNAVALTTPTEKKPTAVTQSSSTSQVHQGPMLRDRKQLFGAIRTAAASGVGTSSYMKLFDDIENKVVSGASEVDIKAQINRLSDALKEQSRRSNFIRQSARQTSIATSPGGIGTAGVGAGTYRIPPALFARIGTGVEVAAAPGKKRGDPPLGLEELSQPGTSGNADQALIRKSAAELAKQRYLCFAQRYRIARAVGHP